MSGDESNVVTRTISYIRKLVFLTISLFVIYHSYLHLEAKRDTCQWLVQHGRFVADNRWQPFGCLLHEYNRTESKHCLRRVSSPSSSQTATTNNAPQTHLIFMGDTRLLQVYNHLIEYQLAPVDHQPAFFNYSIFDLTLQRDFQHVDEELGLVAEFRWRPRPSGELFDDFRRLLHPHSVTTNKRLRDGSDWDGSLEEASANAINRIIVLAHSSWPENESHESFAEAYKTNMTRFLTFLKGLKSSESGTKILLALQDPVVERKTSLWTMVNSSNSLIDELNLITENLVHSLDISELLLVHSFRKITSDLINTINNDGIHSSGLIVANKAQILVNYMCNKVYAFDGTCCNPVREFTLGQACFILAALVIISLHIAHLVRAYLNPGTNNLDIVRWQKVPQYDNTLATDQPDNDDSQDEANNEDDDSGVEETGCTQTCKAPPNKTTSSKQEFIANLAKFFLALLFMFICDRTNFFMKENKYFTLANFVFPLVYMFALGIFFTESKSNSLRSTAMNRNQTDELKGWMQLVVLIYSLTRAEENLRIYMLVRALLSSYLFLTGFGHFTYFLKTSDHSWARYARVILRLNLLVTSLCFLMNRPYQYYYFVPLVTFWFTVIFVFMKIKPIKNPLRITTTDHFWFAIKALFVFALVTGLHLSKWIFDKVFLIQPWSFLFESSHHDAHDWWRHWSTDRYSILAGIVYGFIHWTLVDPNFSLSEIPNRVGYVCHSRESSLGAQDSIVPSDPLKAIRDAMKPRKKLVNILGLVSLLLYILFASLCTDRVSCDEIHAYVSFVPAISYIILRNANDFLRRRHSLLFSFIGKISLELSLCQYHIWLAAGEKGLLVLVPSNPTMNLVITSIIFITTAHKLHHINRKLCNYVMTLITSDDQ